MEHDNSKKILSIEYVYFGLPGQLWGCKSAYK